MGDATGVAMAEAVKRNTVLQSFKFVCAPKMFRTGLAMAEAIKHNTTLRSFLFNVGQTNMGNNVGVAMAEAIQHNRTIQSFTFFVNKATQMDNVTSMAMAVALKHNTALRSIEFNGPLLGIDAATSMAEAIKHNTTLQSFTLDCWGLNRDKHVEDILAEAVKHNITLQSFKIRPQFYNYRCRLDRLIDEHIVRNRAILAQRHALACLARCTDNTGFCSLVGTNFRNKIFSFFVPLFCKLETPLTIECGQKPHSHWPADQKQPGTTFLVVPAGSEAVRPGPTLSDGSNEKDKAESQAEFRRLSGRARRRQSNRRALMWQQRCYAAKRTYPR